MIIRSVSARLWKEDSYKRLDIFVARGGSSIRVWMNLKIVWVGSMGAVTGWESMQYQRGLYRSIGRTSASFYLHKMVFFSPEEEEIRWHSNGSVSTKLGFFFPREDNQLGRRGCNLLIPQGLHACHGRCMSKLKALLRYIVIQSVM